MTWLEVRDLGAEPKQGRTTVDLSWFRLEHRNADPFDMIAVEGLQPGEATVFGGGFVPMAREPRWDDPVAPVLYVKRLS